MSQVTKDKVQAMLMSYLRAGVASCAALYMAGITDPKTLAMGFFVVSSEFLVRGDTRKTEMGSATPNFKDFQTSHHLGFTKHSRGGIARGLP